MTPVMLVLAVLGSRPDGVPLADAIDIVSECDRETSRRFNTSSESTKAALEWSDTVHGTACARARMKEWLSDASSAGTVDLIARRRGRRLAMKLDEFAKDFRGTQALVIMAGAVTEVTESNAPLDRARRDDRLAAFLGAAQRILVEDPCGDTSLPILGFLSGSSLKRESRKTLAKQLQRADHCSPSVTAAWRYLEVEALRSESSPEQLASHIVGDLERGCLPCLVGVANESLADWLPSPVLDTALRRAAQASLRSDPSFFILLANAFGGDSPDWLADLASEGLAIDHWFAQVTAARILIEKGANGVAACPSKECRDVLMLQCLPPDQLSSPPVTDGLWRPCTDSGLAEFRSVFQLVKEGAHSTSRESSPLPLLKTPSKQE